MALIRCPECGCEISDKALSCPKCGCPKEEYMKPKELPPEKRPELFNCVNCGRPLPIGIDRCIYCAYEYKEIKSEQLQRESDTGILGRKNLRCPNCGSKSIHIENDIPFWKKARDIILIGGLMPTTKAEHRQDMEYVCRVCGFKWNEKGASDLRRP